MFDTLLRPKVVHAEEELLAAQRQKRYDELSKICVGDLVVCKPGDMYMMNERALLMGIVTEMSHTPYQFTFHVRWASFFRRTLTHDYDSADLSRNSGIYVLSSRDGEK